ncbi:MAG: MFS transporter [bacterium]
MAMLVMFGAIGLGRFGYTSILPFMQKDLGMSNTEAGFLATANLAGFTVSAAIGGLLASRFGARAVTAAGLALVGLGLVLAGFATGVGSAAVARAMTGIGTSVGTVPAMALVSGWFEPRRRGLASGVPFIGTSIALVVTGPTVPRLIAAGGEEGWRIPWHLFGGIALAMAVAAYLVFREAPREKRFLYSAVPTPIGDRTTHIWRTLSSRPALHLALVYLLFGFSYLIYVTFFTKRLIDDAGYSPEVAGTLFMVVGWASFPCGILWGHASDRIGRGNALASVCFLNAASFTLFAFWTSWPSLVLSAVLFGLSAWSVPGIMTATCRDAFGARLTPAVLGFVTLFYGLGQTVSPTVAGWTADSFSSFRPAFILAAGVALLGAIVAFFFRTPQQAAHETVYGETVAYPAL